MNGTCPRCGCEALDYSPATFTVCHVCGSTFPPVPGRNDRLEPSFADRAVTAIASLLFALATVLFLMFLLRRSRELMFTPAMGWLAVLALVASPVVGFWLGSVRAARAWAVIWGEEKAAPIHYAVLAAFLAVVALLAIFA